MNTSHLPKIKLEKSPKTRELLEDMNKKLEQMQGTLDLLFEIIERHNMTSDLRDIRRK